MAKIYILNYDHLGVILWTSKAMETILKQEEERLKKYPNYNTIGWDSECFAYDYLQEKEPELYRRMKKVIADYPGRIQPGSCTYGQPLSTFICEESNIRQIAIAGDTMEKHFGSRPDFYLSSEHAFHAQLPQILNGCGFSGALFRTHFMMYGANPEIDEPVVRWTGPDGSWIAAIPTYVGQAVQSGKEGQPLLGNDSKFQAVTLDNRILLDSPTRYPSTLGEFESRFGNKISPLVASRVDDPRQPEKSVALYGDPQKYFWSTGSGILSQLPAPKKEFRPEPADFQTRMPWGFCGNWIWNRCRDTERKLLTAERLCMFGGLLGLENPEKHLTEDWKRLMVGQHHDVQIVGLEREAHQYLDPANRDAEKLIERQMRKIAERKDGHDIFIFNPLQWDRKDWIGFEGRGFLRGTKGLGFYSFREDDGASREIPFRWNPIQRILETPFYTVELCDGGGIVSLIESDTGRRIFREGRRNGILAGMIDGKELESHGQTQVVLESQRAVVTETGKIGTIPYVMEWAYYSEIPRIDWKCEIIARRQKIGLPSEDRGDGISAFVHEKKLRILFYPELEEPSLLRDLPFAVAPSTGNYAEGNYWTALVGKKSGFAIFNRGLMGSVLENDGAFSVPLAFSMYYIWDGCLDGVKVSKNNVESMVDGSRQQDGPHFMEGAYRYDLSIRPFTGNWKEAGIHRQALEYNFPCVALRLPEREEKEGLSWLPLQIRSETGILSALYLKGDGMFARFYDCCGETGDISMESSGKKLLLSPVTLLEKPEPERGREETRLRLGPWKIQTIRLRMPPDQPGKA